jgi:UDP-glucose 4-epimerase
VSAGAGTARRTLVTGGAGFIGSHLVDRLLARGDSVTVVDDLSTGRRENIPAPGPALRFIEADLGAALTAFGAGETFQEIYHLAAAVGVKLIVENPARAIETNVEQAADILRFAASHPCAGAPTPILIASSSEVYGKSAKEPFSEDDDVLYGPTTVARWSYATSKAIDEYLALAYHRDGKVSAVIARFFNTVGPRQVGDYGMVLPRFVRAALDGRDLEVHGDGAQSRCFCDVRDVARLLPRLLASAPCRGSVFNVGSDRPISMKDLADLVIRTLSSRSKVRLTPYSDVYGAGFEDLRQRRPDLSRLRRTLGFEPGIALEQTIRDVADWLTSQGRAGR